MRYRHFDNDFFRASRQQDFLRQVSHQDAIRQLLDASKIKELAHIFGQYFEVDDSFVKTSNLIALAQLGLYMAQSKAPVNEVRFPAYEAKNPALDSYLYVKDSDLRKTVRRVHDRQGLLEPAPARRHDQAGRDADRAAGQAQEEQAVLGAGPRAGAHRGREHGRAGRDPGQARFPFYFPGLRKTGSRYAD